MKRQYLALLALLLLIVLVTDVAIQAQTSPGYHLKWNVIVGGGNQSSSASYVLDGTAGESLVGPPSASNVNYRLTIGYTTGRPDGALANHVYLPIIIRSGS